MNKSKKFVIGSLIALPILYFGYNFYDKNANSFEAKIISKEDVWISFSPIDAEFDGYSIVSERYLDGKVQRDTTRVPVPDKNYYIDKVSGYSWKTSNEWWEDVKKLKDEQTAMLENSLTPGRTVRLWVGNTNATYHTITPDKITLIKE